MPIDKMDIAKVTERLRATTKEDWDEGLLWGQEWAEHDATLGQLREVAELVHDHHVDVDGDALFAIDPELPESLNQGDDRNLSPMLARPAFARGFAEGALAVLVEKVEEHDPSITSA